MNKGEAVVINSTRSFEYHGCKAVIISVQNGRAFVKADWGGMKEFSLKSLKPYIKESEKES